MLSAKEAKNKTIIKTECSETMKRLEEVINNQIDKGCYTASVRLLHEKKDNIAIIIDQLTNLGYKVNYTLEEPLPLGCPSDQWDFNSILSITWK